MLRQRSPLPPRRRHLRRADTGAVSASACPPPSADVGAVASLPAPPSQRARLHLPAPARPSPGDLVFVPRKLRPAYACHEHGGSGWTGRVLSLTTCSALVAFPYALDDHGRHFAPIRIPHAHLERFPPSPPLS
eukprot:2411157-Pleurochrysis_carterae.AAC.1